MTNKKLKPSDIRTLQDLHNALPNPNYVKYNPKGGIAKAMQMPNFVKSRKKAKDGHEILHISYTEK